MLGDIMKTYFRNLNLRITQVQMLHVSLGDGWRVVDVVYVLTGKVW
jgi:hypothetical protein